MSFLDKHTILGLDDLRYEDVSVPEWGGSVRVRGMTAAERDAYDLNVFQRNGINIRATLLSFCLVNEKGERLFSDADVETLGRKNGAIIDKLFDVAARLSGAAVNSQEQASGNSESAP